MKSTYFVFRHLPILLYTFFWFGIFIGGLSAPQEQVTLLKSNMITQGWHISLYSILFMWPFIFLYIYRVTKK